MRKIIIGSVFIISAVILYSFVHLSASIYLPNITGWSTPPGRFGTALSETGGVLPASLSIVMGVIGFMLISMDFFRKIIMTNWHRN